jgi:hypothetical protein
MQNEKSLESSLLLSEKLENICHYSVKKFGGVLMQDERKR